MAAADAVWAKDECVSSERRPFLRPNRIVLCLVLAVLVVGAVAFWQAMSGRRPPNVILITIDTLRADHLGAYGYPRPTSPSFDAFARDGILFRRAFSQAPETNPSLSSLMTSRYPHETKVLRNFHLLSAEVSTLAEILRDKGWRTAAIVSNYSLRRGSGLEQGFDAYDDRMEDPNGTTGIAAVQRTATHTTAAATAWLRQDRAQRFFLWVHYMDPHAPYAPPTPYDTMFTDSPLGEHKALPLLTLGDFMRGRNLGGIPYNARLKDHVDLQYYVAEYDGEIRFLDDSLGELLREIGSLGLLDNSLVIITADHGEGMGEHDFFFNHTEFVFTGSIHVPLVIRLPASVVRGRQVEVPVGLIDVFPTVLAVLGIEAPPGTKGHSLLDPQPRPVLSATTFTPGHAALIQKGRKLLYDEGRPSLYDLDHDFYETRDLLEKGSPEDLQTAIQMKEILTTMSEQDDLQLGAPVSWAVEPDVQQQLRTLGYVQ